MPTTRDLEPVLRQLPAPWPPSALGPPKDALPPLHRLRVRASDRETSGSHVAVSWMGLTIDESQASIRWTIVMGRFSPAVRTWMENQGLQELPLIGRALQLFDPCIQGTQRSGWRYFSLRIGLWTCRCSSSGERCPVPDRSLRLSRVQFRFSRCLWGCEIWLC